MGVQAADDLAQLLAAAREGCRESLGTALEGCRQYLLLVANQEFAPELQAKAGPSDIVQDTMLEAQRDFARFRGSMQEELIAWLRQILLNNLRDFRKQFLQTEKRQVSREVALDGDSSCEEMRKSLSSAAASPSELLVEAEDRQAALLALAELPEQYRQVIELRSGEQLSFKQIGARMARSEAAVRKLWCRAVRELSRKLNRDDELR